MAAVNARHLSKWAVGMHKGRQLSNRVVRNSLSGLAAQFAIKLLSFGFAVLVVRHLGAEAYGQYAAVLAFGGVFVFMSDLGLSLFTVREVARWRNRAAGTERIETLYGDIMALRLVLSCATAIIMVATAWLTQRPLLMIGAIALGSLGLIMYSVQGASDAVLGGLERLDISAGARLAHQLVFILVGTIALWNGLGYYGLVIGNLLGIMLITVLCWRAVRRLGISYRRHTLRHWSTLLKASIPFGIVSFTLGISYKFDSILLNIFRTDAETGYYVAAYNLIFSAVLLSNVLNTALYPSLARQAACAPEALPGMFERALRYLMVLALPIAVGGWVLADRLVPFLFTEAYLPAVPALQILIWVIPLMFASEFLGYVALIKGDERRVARAVIVSTSLNVTANMLLVPQLGFIGAALMTVVTEAMLVSQYILLLHRFIPKLNWQRVLFRPAGAALFMGCLVRSVHDLPVPAAVVSGVLLYIGALIALRVVGPDEIDLLRACFSRRALAAPVTPQ